MSVTERFSWRLRVSQLATSRALSEQERPGYSIVQPSQTSSLSSSQHWNDQVLVAIFSPWSESTRQTGSTPNTCLNSSMNATSAPTAGRARRCSFVKQPGSLALGVAG